MLNELIIIASSSSSDSSVGFLAIPFIVAAAIYYFIYRFYRNHDKRYKYESETDTVVKDIQKFDQKFSHRTGLKNRKIQGDNSNNHTARVNRGSTTVADILTKQYKGYTNNNG